MKVEVPVLSSPSLIVLVVSVDVKQQLQALGRFRTDPSVLLCLCHLDQQHDKRASAAGAHYTTTSGHRAQFWPAETLMAIRGSITV